MKLESQVGLTAIIDMIVSSKKIVVGHNCVLDLAFIIGSCLESLPDNVEQYLPMMHKYFPFLFDTKEIIVSNDKLRDMFPNTSLEKAYTSSMAIPSATDTVFKCGFSNTHFRYAHGDNGDGADKVFYHEAGNAFASPPSLHPSSINSFRNPPKT